MLSCASGTVPAPRAVLRCPLPSSCGALGEFPVVAVQMIQVAAGPAGGCLGPSAFQAAGNRVARVARAVAVLPAEALIFDAGSLGFGAHVFVGIGRAVCLAKRVAAGDQRDRLFVVHRHPSKGLADVGGRCHGVGLAVGPLGIHVDESHLHRCQGIGQVALAAVTLVAQPLRFRTPVDVFLWLPGVFSAAGKTEGLEAHRFQGHVAGEHHQVGPRHAPAILLLDGPEQAARLVQVGIVGPTIQGSVPLRAVARAATTVGHPVSSGAVPGHANEERSVMTKVRWPPRLRGRHHLFDVFFQRGKIDLGKLVCVAEIVAHRVRLGGVLPQNRQVQLIRPPVSVRQSSGGRIAWGSPCHRAHAVIVHLVYLSVRIRESLCSIRTPVGRFTLPIAGVQRAGCPCNQYRDEAPLANVMEDTMDDWRPSDQLALDPAIRRP